MHAYVHACMFVSTRVCIHARMHVCMSVCMSVSVYVWMCMYVCIARHCDYYYCYYCYFCYYYYYYYTRTAAATGGLEGFLSLELSFATKT